MVDGPLHKFTSKSLEHNRAKKIYSEKVNWDDVGQDGMRHGLAKENEAIRNSKPTYKGK